MSDVYIIWQSESVAARCINDIPQAFGLYS